MTLTRRAIFLSAAVRRVPPGGGGAVVRGRECRAGGIRPAVAASTTTVPCGHGPGPPCVPADPRRGIRGQEAVAAGGLPAVSSGLPVRRSVGPPQALLGEVAPVVCLARRGGEAVVRGDVTSDGRTDGSAAAAACSVTAARAWQASVSRQVRPVRARATSSRAGPSQPRWRPCHGAPLLAAPAGPQMRGEGLGAGVLRQVRHHRSPGGSSPGAAGDPVTLGGGLVGVGCRGRPGVVVVR